MNRLLLSLIASVLLGGIAARADVFTLASGGQIRGEQVASADVPKDKMLIRTVAGGEVIVEKKQVKQIDPQSPAELEYERIRPTYPDTIDGQWKLAQWCLEHSLSKQRQPHLERVLVLDPNHKEARLALGYRFLEGRWIRQDDYMKEQGYVKYKGSWKLPQEIELIEQRKKQDEAERVWYGKVSRWRAAVGASPDRAQQITNDTFAGADSAAIPAVTKMLNGESVRRVKVMLIDVLVKLGSAGALSTVVNLTLDDPDEEIRDSALDSLTATKHPEITSIYAKALKARSNVTVNRAAACLKKLNDKTAISPLIDALETQHKIVTGGGNPGQTSTTFGNGPGGGGGGLSVGGGPKEVKVWVQNNEVLAALVAITGQNFEWNARAWKSWYASQKKPETIDARRGE